jgi:hypothetical protein
MPSGLTDDPGKKVTVLLMVDDPTDLREILGNKGTGHPTEGRNGRQANTGIRAIGHPMADLIDPPVSDHRDNHLEKVFLKIIVRADQRKIVAGSGEAMTGIHRELLPPNLSMVHQIEETPGVLVLTMVVAPFKRRKVLVKE